MCIKVIIQIAIDKELSLVRTVPDFSPGVNKHRIESGYTVLNRCSPGSGSGGFLQTSVAHRAAKQRRLFSRASP